MLLVKFSDKQAEFELFLICGNFVQIEKNLKSPSHLF
jgi:hypothetical protein